MAYCICASHSPCSFLTFLELRHLPEAIRIVVEAWAGPLRLSFRACHDIELDHAFLTGTTAAASNLPTSASSKARCSASGIMRTSARNNLPGCALSLQQTHGPFGRWAPRSKSILGSIAIGELSCYTATRCVQFPFPELQLGIRASIPRAWICSRAPPG